MRREFRKEHSCQPIKGAPFTFRTFHAPDARYGLREGRTRNEARTVDQLLTVTLPAIWTKSTMEVAL